jgi:hypothetical protein
VRERLFSPSLCANGDSDSDCSDQHINEYENRDTDSSDQHTNNYGNRDTDKYREGSDSHADANQDSDVGGSVPYPGHSL